MFKPKRKSKKKKKKMIDRETTRPRRLASERAKAYFLNDASISKQLEKEERDLRKALKVSRMEALRARRNGNDCKSVKSSSSSTTSTSSLSSASSSSSSSSSPSSPLLSLPTTPKTTTKATRTASSTINQKRKTKMGKPKAMEISTKNIKGCCKTMNQVKPMNDEKPKSKCIIRTRSQNPKESTSQLITSYEKLFNCDEKPNHQTIKSNGKIIDSTQLKNGSTRGTSSSSMVPCATLSKDNGINGLIPTSNGENCDKPRPKIMAQRKFASITYNCNTYLKPRDPDLSPIQELFTKHKPSAEDFLTFLCFKSTDLLPPHLDFYSLNNITTSQDDSNVIPNDTPSTTTNDKTANISTADNCPTIKSNLKQQQSNTTSNSSSYPGTTFKPNAVVRKRGMTCTFNRHPIVNRKKEPDLMVSSKSNNTHANRKNGMKPSKNTSHLDTSRTTQRTNKTVKVSSRACKQPTIKSTSTDENRPKKSSVLPLKRSTTCTTSRHKSPTKVKISKERTTVNSKNDQKTIFNGRVSNKSQPKTNLSNVNAENSNKRKVSKKVNCDRILRSTRSSSLTTSNTESCLIMETVPPIENGKSIETEKLDPPIMMNKPEKSAINGNQVDNSDRKRKCNGTEIILENGKKRGTSTIWSECDARRSKKVETIEPLPSTSTSISTNLRKDSMKSVPHRIETRSHTQRSRLRQ